MGHPNAPLRFSARCCVRDTIQAESSNVHRPTNEALRLDEAITARVTLKGGDALQAHLDTSVQKAVIGAASRFRLATDPECLRPVWPQWNLKRVLHPCR